jgi:hypothetical protein
MERAYMPPAEPPPLEHDTWGAPHPKAAVAGPRPEPQGSTHLRSSRPRQRLVVSPNKQSFASELLVVLADRLTSVRRAALWLL